MLAKGSSNTPDTFIAGEAGPELITNAPGRTVFTASQTRSIMAAQNTAATTAAAVAPTTAPTTTAQTVNNYNTAPEVTAGAGNNGGGAKNVTINNNPTIVVNGDKPEDLDAKLEENNKRLLRDVEELLDEKKTKKGGRNMTKSYTTISGDMWDKIAYNEMGSVLHTDKLMKANVKYASTYVFPAGVVLTIPEVEDEEDLELPPWKRGLLT